MTATSPAGLARTLATAGHLSDPRWREAFAAIPRHVFVPRFYRDDRTLVEGSETQDRSEWLHSVYSDQTLTTQVMPIPGTNQSVPTSSSTRPSLMARMLHLLEIGDGSRVLEIGTGTGYNAALLCHRLGDRQVTSVDLDPQLIARARDALASLGYHPHLRSGTEPMGLPRTPRMTGSSPPPRWRRFLRPGSLSSRPAGASSPTCGEISSAP
jgi:protein-L-isoaspartate O-methyltransferase